MRKNNRHTSRIDALANLRAALGDSLSPVKPAKKNGIAVRRLVQNDFAENNKASTEGARETPEKKALGKIFPHGLPTGELIEFLHRGSGCGVLALCLARTASRDGRAIAVIDPEHQFYPHAALALGIGPEQLLVLRPTRGREEMWALDQTIRCRGFAAVLWRGKQLQLRHLRRLQLACEKYNTLGLLLRPQAMSHQLTAARTRLRVESIHATGPEAIVPSVPPVPRAISHTQRCVPHNSNNSNNSDSFFLFSRLRIERLRGAHLAAGSGIELEIDHENGTFRQAVSLPVAS